MKVREAVILMNDNENIIAMAKENNGFITSSKVTDAGIQRRIFSELVKSGRLYRVERGIYVLPETWEDEMFFIQHRFAKGIFSCETALYLHGLSDRTPISYTMTFPHGYNTHSVKEAGIIAKLVMPEIYKLGIVEMLSSCGNPIKTYDRERTLCDIVKGNNTCDISLVNQAMKAYAISREKNVNRLIAYAEQLRVKPKILRYMEVLL